jgi:glycosyltransferase involved in cell wall biosynthesis
MVMKETIVYVGNFSFPKNNSAGIRVLNNGYLFRELGYNVVYIGLSKTVSCIENSAPSHKEYDGFRYFEFPYPKGLKDWLFFSKQLKTVIAILKDLEPKSVIAYGSMSNAFFCLFLGWWCKAQKIKFITDCVDWLGGASGGRIFRIGKRLDTELQKRYVNTIGDGVITVSSFLADYYIRKSCSTLILPPLSKENTYKSKLSETSKNKKIRFIYAGFPFPTDRKVKDKSFFKDRLDKTIELLALQQKGTFIFDIYGVTLNDYIKSVPEHEKLLSALNGTVNFYGMVSNEVVVNKVSEADYFFLFRDSNRMTNAGFPSKIVEAISLGTPVITTATSDIAMYITNDVNGHILSKDNDEKSALELSKIFDEHDAKHNMLKRSCFKSNPFDIKSFTNSTKQFMKSI